MPPGARILIAEDEPRISAFLQKGLRANRYATEVVTSADDAVRLASSNRFDLAILDLRPPNPDPARLVREVRRVQTRLPVIVLATRFGGSVPGLHSGSCDFVRKPFRFAELLDRVRARLASETQQRRQPTPRRLRASS